MNTNSEVKSKLNNLLTSLTAFGNIHICIHDFTGLLTYNDLSVDYRFKIHSTKFCAEAKSTKSGTNVCLLSKSYSNSLVMNSAKPRLCICPFGMCELCYPVTIDGNVRCALYVGHVVKNREDAHRRIERTCKKTGVSESIMKRLSDECPTVSDDGILYTTAKAVSDFIRMLYEVNKDVPVREKYHWAVADCMRYADENFTRQCTLREVSKLYMMNEKYLGKLFKAQTGRTFHEYLTAKRLEKAEKYLLGTDMKIIDVAFESGFETVTYFNRVFAKKYGKSPTEFRLG